MCRCHVVDQLHDKDCFSNAGTTEQTDFSALGIRADQVNDLDSGFEDLRCRNLFLIGRRIAVDRPFFCCFRCRLIVYGLTEQVEHAAQALLSDRNGDRAARVDCFRSADKSVCGLHGNAADHVVARLLRHFHNQLLAVVVYLDGVQKCRQLSFRKTDIQNRTRYLHNLANVFFTHLTTSPHFSCFHSYTPSAPPTISVISCVMLA